ncbi:MAG: hypothetical protein LBS70_09000 [Candidatus Accumulibacter sp.]|jgi:REP element-mobilizing transposase RayT|nr:hypothetical protein [Accumulibacter sp.]
MSEAPEIVARMPANAGAGVHSAVNPSDDAGGILPVRRRNRLRDYDYSREGAYFVTVCARNRAAVFGRIVGANCVRPLAAGVPPRVELSALGRIVKDETDALHRAYPMVRVDKSVVMPNHVHLLMTIEFQSDGGRTQFAPTVGAPTVSRIVKQWKGVISKRAGFSPWQKSFHDHVIRNQNDFDCIAEYIENNPVLWNQDCFFVEASADETGGVNI